MARFLFFINILFILFVEHWRSLSACWSVHRKVSQPLQVVCCSWSPRSWRRDRSWSPVWPTCRRQLLCPRSAKTPTRMKTMVKRDSLVTSMYWSVSQNSPTLQTRCRLRGRWPCSTVTSTPRSLALQPLWWKHRLTILSTRVIPQ